MSTKIYSGFQFDDADLTEIWPRIAAFRDRANQWMRDRVARWVASEVAELIDDVACGARTWNAEKDGEFHPLKHVWTDLEERWKVLHTSDCNSVDAAEVDFRFGLAIFPLADGRLLGIYLTREDELRDLWLEMGGVTEYGYWNNSDDRPKGVRRAEWDRRRRDWEEALPDSPRYSSIYMQGLSIQCVDSLLPHLERAEYLPHIPSFEDRVRRVAKYRLVTRKMNEALPAGDTWTAHAASGAYMDAMRWLRGAEGMAALAQEEASVSTILKPELSEADILGYDRNAR